MLSFFVEKLGFKDSKHTTKTIEMLILVDAKLQKGTL
jgi:hypothetical protein